MKRPSLAEPIYFPAAADFRAWLEKNHRTATDLLVGFHKAHVRGDDRPCMTWEESVAEALCYGWIDGQRRRLDAERYTIRFTPRRKGSTWSAVNIRLIAELDAAGRMTDAGRAAFDARRHKAGPLAAGYKAQKKHAELDDARARQFRMHAHAWAFFESQPPGYRRAAAWWVMHAKQESTRDRRFAKLIDLSAAGKRVM